MWIMIFFKCLCSSVVNLNPSFNARGVHWEHTCTGFDRNTRVQRLAEPYLPVQRLTEKYLRNPLTHRLMERHLGV